MIGPWVFGITSILAGGLAIFVPSIAPLAYCIGLCSIACAVDLHS